jgi:hypothetical protein
VDSECRVFQEKWTDEYFCVSMNGKALCSICSESTAVLKECNIVRHYNSKHKEKHKNRVHALRTEKAATLKQKRKSSGSNPMIVPLHCRPFTVLFTCWLKNKIFFRCGIRKKMFATQCKRFVRKKEQFLYYKFVSCNNNAKI